MSEASRCRESHLPNGEIFQSPEGHEVSCLGSSFEYSPSLNIWKNPCRFSPVYRYMQDIQVGNIVPNKARPDNCSEIWVRFHCVAIVAMLIWDTPSISRRPLNIIEWASLLSESSIIAGESVNFHQCNTEASRFTFMHNGLLNLIVHMISIVFDDMTSDFACKNSLQ
jgi:hypothetical protein